jgi:hypothetical protein
LISDLVQKEPQAIRQKILLEELVLVDGQPGCGKTLFTAIIAAMTRVELLQYSAVLENICALYYLNKITKDAAIAILQIEFDLVLYETMMSRNTNFRPKDLSSAYRDVKFLTYLKRLFQEGDEKIPQKILDEKPILHFASHSLLGFADILMCDVAKKLSIIEVVRHPLYMVIQQSLNHENWAKKNNTARQFHLYINKNGENVPYYVNDWKLNYSSLKPVEKAIYEIAYMTKQTEKFKKNNSGSNILTIPFESFVLDPFPYMKAIEKTLKIKMTSITKKVMKKQKVPRKKISDGIPLDIYKRCGWEPPDKSITEKEELIKRRQFAVDNGASKDALNVLDKLSENYENKYFSFGK